MTPETRQPVRHSALKPALAALTTLSLFACSANGATDAVSPAAPTPVATQAAARAPAAAPIEAMTAAIEDEYHAEAVYKRVLLDHGTVLPFANIVRAEQNHAAAIAALFAARGIGVPASAWNVDNVPGFAATREACAAAAQAEIDNVELYDGYLSLDLPTDVRTVFTNNRAASLNNHLPAFRACS